MNSHSIEQLDEWDRLHLWHPFTQMGEYEPLILAAGQGSKLIDIQGRQYIDGVSSLWCNIHGHRHPQLDAALKQQIDQLSHATLLGSSNPPAILLAKRLADLAPGDLNHVFFSDDGATAIEAALKMAFQYWQQCPQPQPEKTKFLALGEAYHGDTLGSVSVGDLARFHALFGPLLFPTYRAAAPSMYRLPPGVTPETACQHFLQTVENVLQQHHQHIAAFILEPLVQGAAGMLVHPPGYLHGVRELTQRYNVLLIADEVAVGFGRTGTMFACQQENVTPDLMCLAKGLTAGYLPLAATLATDRIWQAFYGRYEENKHFYHGHTYSGNPLGAAVALASLDIFESEQTLSHLPPKIERLSSHLSRISQLPHVGDVRQRGLMAGIELVQNLDTAEPFPWPQRRGHRVCELVRRQGVLLRPLGNVLVIMPPLCISLEEIDRICTSVEEAIPIVTTEKF